MNKGNVILIAGLVLVTFIVMACEGGEKQPTAAPTTTSTPTARPTSTSIATRTRDAEAYVLEGLWLMTFDRDEEALDKFTEAIEIDPNLAQAYVSRAWVYIFLGQVDLATADSLKAKDLDPNSFNPGFDLAMYNAFLYNYESYSKPSFLNAAIAELTSVLESDQMFNELLIAFAYDFRAALYFKNAQPMLAIADAEKVIEIAPEYPTAYITRGQAWGFLEDLDQEIADYTRAIELSVERNFLISELDFVYGRRARAYIKKGDLELGIADATEAIRLNPNEAIAYVNRGYAYEQLGDCSKARQDWEKALSLAQFGLEEDPLFVDKVQNNLNSLNC